MSKNSSPPPKSKDNEEPAQSEKKYTGTDDSKKRKFEGDEKTPADDKTVGEIDSVIPQSKTNTSKKRPAKKPKTTERAKKTMKKGASCVDSGTRKSSRTCHKEVDYRE